MWRAVTVAAVFWPVLAATAPPVVTNVRAAQQVGTELVDIYYDVAAGVPPLTGAVQVSADGGATFALNAVLLTGDVGGRLQPANTIQVSASGQNMPQKSREMYRSPADRDVSPIV